MEKSLPYVSLHDKENPQKQAQQPQSTSNPPLWQDNGYDTHLLPRISLPQRQQRVIGEPRVGLLHYAAPIAQNDPGLTVGMDQYELARRIAAAKQAQVTPPTGSVMPASISYTDPVPPVTFKQQYMQARQSSAQRAAAPPAQPVDDPTDKRSVGSEELRDIRYARTRVVVKAVVASGLFAGVACMIWTLFSRNSMYLIATFIILAVMLGGILSSSMGDYYQLGLSKFRTTLQLRAVNSPRMSDALREVRAPHLRMQDDTSGYLNALRKTFPKKQERRSDM